MPDIDKHWFTLYYFYYKENFVSNPNWTFACITKPSFAIKKRELSKTSLHFIFCLLKSPSLFSLTFPKLLL